MSHGTFCFMSFDGYGWYLSSTAALLYFSWIVHNLVAWLKIKPFLTRRASKTFIGTLCLTIAPTLLQIVNNFLFFNNIRDQYVRVRPFEVLMRLVNTSASAIHVLIGLQRSMVDFRLHSILLCHQDTPQGIGTRTYQRSPSLRHNAASNAPFHYFHRFGCSLERSTKIDCS